MKKVKTMLYKFSELDPEVQSKHNRRWKNWNNKKEWIKNETRNI